MLRSALRLIPSTDSRRSEAPAFARAVACARLEAPFREGVAALYLEPGEVVLCARLPAELGAASIPLHWEVARDEDMHTRERYGLLAARPGESVRIALHALEKGRAYWYRLWAGGHWSHTGHFHSGVRQSHVDPSVRLLRPRPRTPAEHALGA